MGKLHFKLFTKKKTQSSQDNDDKKPKHSISADKVREGLVAALDGQSDIVASHDKLLYQIQDAKPYNLNYPIIPAAVTYPRTAEQIAAIVKYGAEAGLKVQARSGGHSYANYCIGGADGAIVVDMKHFQHFSMDEETWIATIGAGTLLEDVTNRLYDAGRRAIAHGVCPQVGAGGHLTIGGFGPMSRMWGTALDHVIEVKVVLADGRIVQANESENPDIFFAIKGAASGFGIVTEFVVRTHPAPGNAVRYSYTLEVGSFTSMANTFKQWLKLISNPELSRKLYTQVTLCQIGMIVSGTFFGTQEEFNALGLDGIFPNHKANVIYIEDWLGMVAHWTEDIGLHIVGGVPCAFYSKCLAYKIAYPMSDKCVDNLLKYLDTADKGTLLWFLNFELQGGATNDIPSDSTAYAHRDVLYYSESFGIDIGRVTKTTHNFITGINDVITSNMPDEKFGSYPGYVDVELPNAQESYWGANLPRLERIKREIDPTDVFHNPQSVRPARS
ncbi:hypothetical protein F5884DRAFT_671455 [Xylogone sp. PMI_703]|nr:hypothetical protein F5884DRAFT_671455 [Xylogone sp. PMI_703]